MTLVGLVKTLTNVWCQQPCFHKILKLSWSEEFLKKENMNYISISVDDESHFHQHRNKNIYHKYATTRHTASSKNNVLYMCCDVWWVHMKPPLAVSCPQGNWYQFGSSCEIYLFFIVNHVITAKFNNVITCGRFTSNHAGLVSINRCGVSEWVWRE